MTTSSRKLREAVARKAAPRPLSCNEKIAAFKACTGAFPKGYGKEIAAGMTDAQLKSALEQAIGIMGGRSATKSWPAASYGGAGLKIWVGWEWPGEKKPPTFAGLTTVALARQIYGIRDPEERQHSLL